MKQRIWELDVLRGIFVWGMIAVHVSFDLVDLYGIWHLADRTLYNFGQAWAGMPFVVISGLCASFGRHPVKRGIQVFLCGMLCTAVTLGMYWLGMSGKGLIIRFGVLHCIGVCMLLWPLLRKCPTAVLLVLGAAMIPTGLYLRDHVRVSVKFLFPLGLPYPGFSSGDYFPLLPNLGYFLVGAGIGRLCYRQRRSLICETQPDNVLIRFLSFCGRNSLPIYLLHQPVIAGVVGLIALMLN